MGHEERSTRWWPLLLTLGAIVVALIWVWSGGARQRQDRVVSTFLVAAAGYLLVALWLLAFSRLRWRRRLLGLGALVLLPLAAALLLERRGVTGDVVPVMRWRWDAAPRFDRSAPATAPSPSAAGTEGDYPQFLGPRRDATVRGVRLARNWSARPPRELWRRAVGAGWSAFAISGARAVTQEQRGAEEVVACYERSTGRPLWVHGEPVRHEDALGGPGPRATPAIHEGLVYALGATGRLLALDLETGGLLWSVDVLEDNAAEKPTYGVAGSPLVVDDVVVVLAGGPAGRSLVAYDRRSGVRVWSGGDDPAAYSSPLRARLAGRDQVVVLNLHHVVGHDAVDGTPLWKFPWPVATEKVSQPLLVPGDRLFVSTGYGVGGKLLGIVAHDDGEQAVDLLWESQALKAKFTNVVVREGYLYGLDDGRLAAVELATGRRVWKGGRYGHGQVILVDDLLLVQAEDGAVALVEATPREWRELGRVPVLAGKTWNHPALAGSQLFVRNDAEAACYELPLGES